MSIKFNLVGQTFGLLTVIRRAPDVRRGRYRKRTVAWLCRCSCGQEVVVRSYQLRAGRKHCCHKNGHTWQKVNAKYLPRHPAARCWDAMWRRCRVTEGKHFRLYAGRGIKVCDRWKDFKTFAADMGPRPSPQHTIDRIDGNGNYEPGNCRWATPSQQRRNSRDNIFIDYRGKRMLLVELAEQAGVRYATLKGRIVVMGWSIEDALSKPVRKWSRRNS